MGRPSQTEQANTGCVTAPPAPPWRPCQHGGKEEEQEGREDDEIENFFRAVWISGKRKREEEEKKRREEEEKRRREEEKKRREEEDTRRREEEERKRREEEERKRREEEEKKEE